MNYFYVGLKYVPIVTFEPELFNLVQIESVVRFVNQQTGGTGLLVGESVYYQNLFS
jgi:hypothetical protein